MTVEQGNTAKYAGKRPQRYTKAGLVKGQKAAFKKAIVTLKEGESGRSSKWHYGAGTTTVTYDIKD